MSKSKHALSEALPAQETPSSTPKAKKKKEDQAGQERLEVQVRALIEPLLRMIDLATRQLMAQESVDRAGLKALIGMVREVQVILEHDGQPDAGLVVMTDIPRPEE